VSTGAKEDESRLGCWISPSYGPFSLGARFETYVPVIYFILQFFSGRGCPRVLNLWIRGHDCIQIKDAVVYGV
jgi:hypothetical protein